HCVRLGYVALTIQRHGHAGIPKPDEMITVAIVDDNRLVREALAAMLDRLPDLRVVAVGVADPAFLDETKPDVLLLDVGLRDEDSLRVAAALTTRARPTQRIVMEPVP